MRALVVGASGLVGGAIHRVLGASSMGTYRNRPVAGLRWLDATDTQAFAALLEEHPPDVVFMPAGEPNVEWCEAHPEEARELNLAPIRTALRLAGPARIVGFSSDYVFDGQAGPYEEGAATRPLSVYGRVKLELEMLLLGAGQTVVRTTTVFGPELDPAKNFVLRLVAALRRGETVRVPIDQVSTPTYSVDLAACAVRLAAAEPGIWHVSGPDLVARSELAVRAARVFGAPEAGIRLVPTSDLDQAARRPLRGGLLCPRYRSAYGPPGRPLDGALADLRRTLG